MSNNDFNVEISLDRIVTLIEHAGITAYVEQTGGGIATIFAGQQRVQFDDEGNSLEDDRWDAAGGPGWFQGEGWTDARATLLDFVVGVDDMGEIGTVTPLRIGAHTEAGIAALIVAQVHARRRALTREEITALGFDPNGQQTPVNVRRGEIRTGVFMAVSNAVNHALIDLGFAHGQPVSTTAGKAALLAYDAALAELAELTESPAPAQAESPITSRSEAASPLDTTDLEHPDELRPGRGAQVTTGPPQ